MEKASLMVTVLTPKALTGAEIRARVAVKTAADFAKVAKEACPKPHVEFVPKKDIQEGSELDEHWSLVGPIPNEFEVHFVATNGLTHLHTRE